jgi:DNA-binding winged helix-turn-helix (wHTH) protein
LRYAFGRFVLDTDTRQLLAEGKEVALGPKPFELLELLLHSRPHVLSRTRLKAALWPDTHVGPTSLHVLVSQVRAALGEGPDGPGFLRTVHRFGYAFSGEATDDSPAGLAAVGPRGPASRVKQRLTRDGEDLWLQEGESLIGREDTNAIKLEGPGVSRHHARLVVAGDRVTIEDLGSKNGTFVRGERLTAPTVLQDGDEVALGHRVKLTFRANGEPETETEGGSGE